MKIITSDWLLLLFQFWILLENLSFQLIHKCFDFFEMKLLLFEIMLLSNLIMLFVIQSHETLLVILRNFVDNISISYLFPKLLTKKFFDRGLHFSATNVKMFLKIVEFIAFFGFNKLFWKCFWILLIQGLEYLILSTMGSSSLYFQRSLLRSL